MARNNDKLLFDAVKKNYYKKESAVSFFEAYEAKKNHDIEETYTYHQLKAFHYPDEPWKHYNKLADMYLKDGQEPMAYRCLVESLRLNATQTDIYDLARSIEENVKPAIPKEIKSDKRAVSVIMATYNRGERLRESIQSLMNQTFQDFELIVVNDGGGDQAKEIVDSFCSDKIKYYKLEKNKGSYGALNEGALKAEGKYITVLDDDDVYYPRHLEVLLNTITQSSCRLVFTNTKRVLGKFENEMFKSIEEVLPLWGPGFSREKLPSNNWMSALSVLFEKKIFKEVGLWNEALHSASDNDFWLRVGQITEIQHIDETTCEYRLHGNNTVLKNQAKLNFDSNLVRRYHTLYQGRIAYAKYYLGAGEKEKAYSLYEEMRQKYEGYYQSSILTEELVYLAEYFSDEQFLLRLSGDFFRYDAKKCAKTIIREKSFAMLLRVAPLLPQRIFRSIVGRTGNVVKKLSNVNY